MGWAVNPVALVYVGSNPSEPTIKKEMEMKEKLFKCLRTEEVATMEVWKEKAKEWKFSLNAEYGHKSLEEARIEGNVELIDFCCIETDNLLKKLKINHL